MIPPTVLLSFFFKLFTRPVFLVMRSAYNPKVKTSKLSKFLIKIGKSSHSLEYKIKKSWLKVKNQREEHPAMNQEWYFERGLIQLSEIVLAGFFFLIGRVEYKEYMKKSGEREKNFEESLENVNIRLDLIEKEIDEMIKLMKGNK